MFRTAETKGPKKLGPFLFFLAVVIVMVVYVNSAFCINASEYHNQAAEFANKKQWPDAISNEQKALNQDPSNIAISQQLAIYYNNYALALFKKGRYDLALVNFKQALKYNPSSATVKDNMYNITLQEAWNSLNKGRGQEAVNLAKECLSLKPGNASAYILLGNLYYDQNKLKQAVEYWDKALALNPKAAGIKEAVRKAQRELKVEKGFKTRPRAYFDVRFEGKKNADIAWDVIDMLGDARRRIKSNFGFFTDKKVIVIIYNTEQFRHVTKMHDWTLGAYDGKVRLKISDVLLNPKLARRVIYHEYGHAILHILYPGNLPLWMHEGFAQFNEPEKIFTPKERGLIREALKRQSPYTLGGINKLFKSSKQDEVNTAYLLSRFFIQYLVGKYGKYKFKKLIERLSSGSLPDKAFYYLYRQHAKDIISDFYKNLKES